jgi:hypothetical protein
MNADKFKGLNVGWMAALDFYLRVSAFICG